MTWRRRTSDSRASPARDDQREAEVLHTIRRRRQARAGGVATATGLRLRLPRANGQHRACTGVTPPRALQRCSVPALLPPQTHVSTRPAVWRIKTLTSSRRPKARQWGESAQSPNTRRPHKPERPPPSPPGQACPLVLHSSLHRVHSSACNSSDVRSYVCTAERAFHPVPGGRVARLRYESSLIGCSARRLPRTARLPAACAAEKLSQTHFD
jgi:hypothetical protein